VSVLSVGALNWIKSIELQANGAAATFSLKKISLINDATRVANPINPPGALEDKTRWRESGKIDVANFDDGRDVKPEDIGAAIVFENTRARPRAWLANEVLRLSPADAFIAVRTSRLPNGGTFDSARTALIEEPIDFRA